jgi:hypothetical protein
MAMQEVFEDKGKERCWTNLRSHLRSCVGKDYGQLFAELEKLKASKEGGGYFVRISDRKKEMFKWIEFVVMKNLPVSIVDCPYTRDITRLKNVSAQTFCCHILELLSVVKETIQAELPPKFIIVFDGWTEGTHHYIGIPAAFLKVGANGKEAPVQSILSMNPLLADGIKGMRATDDLEHVKKVLESYGKTLENILCLVGDDCSVNQSMARILGKPLIGCASHKFNLAVCQWISQQAELTPIIKKAREPASV